MRKRAVTPGGLLRQCVAAITGLVTVAAGQGYALGAGTASTSPSFTKNYNVIYEFKGAPDGAAPEGKLVVDGSGTIFGVTSGGGSANCGTVFALVPKGSTYSEKILYSFGIEPDACTPQDGPIEDAGGNLYITTLAGGFYNGGAVVELSPTQNGTYQETAVHSFGHFPDGTSPASGLLAQGSTGYIATSGGGQYGLGAIAALTIPGLTETAVYNVPSNSLAGPNSTLAADASGALYGTSGAVYGALFKFVPSTGDFMQLWSFSNGPHGPTGGVLLDGGNIYGTTESGENGSGGGSVYQLTPTGSTYALTVLHTFSKEKDGDLPLLAGLVPSGAYLYGATAYGGSTSGACSEGIGCGVIYRLMPSGGRFGLVERLSGTNGSTPNGPLTASGKKLFGTTFGGGAGFGIVYAIGG
jgi:uncharacterized repeat protein (TIGR03803 family)